MNLRSVRFSRSSMLLLLVQLAIVSTVTAEYVYQRWTCPRAWAKVVGFDPELPMRGRYLSLQLFVDACGSTLPNASAARFPRGFDGTVQSPRYTISARGELEFSATLAVQHDRLTATKLPDSAPPGAGLRILAPPGAPCEAMRLADSVSLYLPEHAASPFPLKPGTELWMQVTVPRSGSPRPLALALQQGGKLRQLTFN